MVSDPFINLDYVIHLGENRLQFSSIVPMTVPGGLDTSILCRKQQEKGDVHLTKKN